eukprot:5783139-Amphidinium_carterae.1
MCPAKERSCRSAQSIMSPKEPQGARSDEICAVQKLDALNTTSRANATPFCHNQSPFPRVH